MLDSIYKFFKLIKISDPKLLGTFFFLVMIIIIAAITEYLILAGIIPFLNFILNNEASELSYISKHIFFFTEMLIPATTLSYIYIMLIIFSGIIRIYMQWLQNKFIYKFAHKITTNAYEKIISQNFMWHKNRSSSQGLATLNSVFYLVGGFIVPITQLLSGIIIALGILSALLYVNFKATFTILGISATIYLIVMTVSRSLLNKMSHDFAASNEKRTEIAKESILGIREIILNNMQSEFLRKFTEEDYTFNSVRSLHNFLGVFPRYLIETILLSIVAGLAVFASNQAISLEKIFPILLLFLISGQKILPLVNQVFVSWAALTGNKKIIQDVANILYLKNDLIVQEPQGSKLNFKKAIQMRNIDFSYKDKKVLKNFNLKIQFGEKVGIMGASGSGKSTLLDLLTGLLKPDAGEILVDGKILLTENNLQWWSSINYLSQNPYILNTSLLENITLTADLNLINYKKVEEVIKIACLKEFIDSTVNGMNTHLGEAGKNLSGGQKQRIAIARSLYSDKDLIIWDEATSALDVKTERKILDNLPTKTTMIFISHNKDSLLFCNKKIILDGI
jgi:ATP-binding cassette, subfamily B, bacterial PglK